MDMIRLQEKFIGEIAGNLDVPWDRIEIHYELFERKGDVMEKYVSQIHHGQQSGPLPLSHEALEVLLALNRCKPDGQAQRWTWFDFTLASDGTYRFDYEY